MIRICKTLQEALDIEQSFEIKIGSKVICLFRGINKQNIYILPENRKFRAYEIKGGKTKDWQF